VNDAPVVADVQLATAEDTALVIALGVYATDVDSATLTTQIVTGPVHGVLVANADGSYTYTPDANYNGADSFTYKANDGELESNLATVNLNVTPVNDAPTLGDLNLAAVEDTALTMNLLTAASDIEGDALTAAIVATAKHGQANINADGSFTYTPDRNYEEARGELGVKSCITTFPQLPSMYSAPKLSLLVAQLFEQFRVAIQ
jgi:VCBS repeat-containing protein